MTDSRWHARFGARIGQGVIALGLSLSLVAAAGAQPEWSAPPPACIYSGPSATDAAGTLCIRKDNFSHDLCIAIDHFAEANQLPPDFFARLIWRESSFHPKAVSPKGARGIAQFMPGTAELRGLENSEDAVEALRKSAEYLRELRDRFGNLGLAAAAYNAGENGLAAYLTSGRLPGETRSYVIAITAHSIEEWKSDPPDTAAPQLDQGKSFLDGCIALADSGRLNDIAPEDEGVWAPWGAQLSAHLNAAVARRLFVRATSELPSPLNAERPLLIRQHDPSFGFRPRYAARFARETRAEADAVCTEVRRHGGVCLVFKN